MYLEKTKLERQKNREQKANPTTYESSESISEGKIVDWARLILIYFYKIIRFP